MRQRETESWETRPEPLRNAKFIFQISWKPNLILILFNKETCQASSSKSISGHVKYGWLRGTTRYCNEIPSIERMGRENEHQSRVAGMLVQLKISVVSFSSTGRLQSSVSHLAKTPCFHMQRILWYESSCYTTAVTRQQPMCAEMLTHRAQVSRVR
jgi:hypothetical protein